MNVDVCTFLMSKLFKFLSFSVLFWLLVKNINRSLFFYSMNGWVDGWKTELNLYNLGVLKYNYFFFFSIHRREISLIKFHVSRQRGFLVFFFPQ